MSARIALEQAARLHRAESHWLAQSAARLVAVRQRAAGPRQPRETTPDRKGDAR